MVSRPRVKAFSENLGRHSLIHRRTGRKVHHAMRGQAKRGMMRPRRGLLRVAALLATVTMLIGVVRAGGRYFYCPMMHVVIDAPCCAGDRRSSSDEDRADSVEMRSSDCCEEHVLRKLPSGAVSPAPPVFDAPLVAVISAVAVTYHAPPEVTRSRFDHENRAGPASTARHRAELMVFLN